MQSRMYCLDGPGLIGAVVLLSGWTFTCNFLHTACLVIGPFSILCIVTVRENSFLSPVQMAFGLKPIIK